jgi:hypothetical protein
MSILILLLIPIMILILLHVGCEVPDNGSMDTG